MLFGNQLLVLLEGVGVKRARSAALAHRFYDGLVEAVKGGCLETLVRRVLHSCM